MILRFKTKRNVNGWREYLAIDTDKKVYTTTCPRMVMDGEEITRTAKRNIKNACIAEGYKDYIEAF